MTIAALYVESDGAYAGLDGVDLWDIERDAREYVGPSAVVAHPPCNWWSMPLAKVNRTRYGHALGRDGGCFAHALWAVKTFGGVLEHPANTSAWEFFGLAHPKRGTWSPAGKEWRWGEGRRFWVTEVSQSAYGHRAVKRTWLFYSGWPQPPPLDWSEPSATAVTSWLQRTTTELPRLAKKTAKQTPLAFRDLLLDLAELSTLDMRPPSTAKGAQLGLL